MEDEPRRLSGLVVLAGSEDFAMAARRARSDFHASSAGARRTLSPRVAALPPVRSLPPNVGTAVMSRTGTRTRTSMSGRPSEATTRTGWGPPRKRAISSRGRTVADSPMRCAGSSSRSVEALEAQSQVRAALASRQRVHFVDDDGFHGAQRLARLRREHEVQRLGRGDEDVGRVALVLRR